MEKFTIDINSNLKVEGEIHRVQSSNKIIVFSPGFGVKRYGYLNLFSELYLELKDQYSAIFMDYMQEDEEGNSYVVRLTEQAKMLEAVITRVQNANPEYDITIIGHSQGGTVATLLPINILQGIQQVIMIASPIQPPYERWSKYFSQRPETVIDENGISRIKRSDGRITYVPAEFINDIREIIPYIECERASKYTKIAYISALEDETVTDDRLPMKNISTLEYYELHGDHNFIESSRLRLFQKVKEITKESLT
ncbi:MAG TPA: YqiA/YcfP family alpha/beta fold hydrolase [Candidatus Dojkabacteria bacterium]|nr:YqiA/YcfP family alpha/beta fold hydrolase [Candidatus Dojkabacteria bacterium]